MAVDAGPLTCTFCPVASVVIRLILLCKQGDVDQLPAELGQTALAATRKAP